MKFKRITLVSDSESWLNAYLSNFQVKLKNYADDVCWHHRFQEISQCDIVFYLSFSKIVPKDVLQRSQHNLVVHESRLPEGKGWSPLTWQILEGKNEVPITLFEAAETVDSGVIYRQDVIHYEGHELVEELRRKQAEHTLQLCMHFIQNYEETLKNAYQQVGTSTFYQRRTPKESRLDLDKTLREQINLLRVVDNDRYPAYFEYLGHTYQIKIKKVDEV